MNWVDRVEFYIDNHIKQPFPEYTVQTTSGFPVLERPNPQLVKFLAGNNKVQYVPSRIPDRWNDGSGRLKESKFLREQIAEERSTGGYYLYYELALEPLLAQLKTDFEDRDYILLRGLAASLGGTLWNLGTIVRDINSIIKAGRETPRKRTLLAFFSPQEEQARIPERTGQWSVKAALDLREKFDFIRGAAGKIFPVVLAYDPNQVEWISGYEHKLPANRDSVILKAYALDYPYYNRNVRGKWEHPMYLPPVSAT